MQIRTAMIWAGLAVILSLAYVFTHSQIVIYLAIGVIVINLIIFILNVRRLTKWRKSLKRAKAVLKSVNSQ
jgi:hypothetical protein